MKQIKVCIVTGGTGGHIYPALSVADACKANNYPVTFIGNKANMEASIIPSAGYVFYGIKNRGFSGNLAKKVTALLSQLSAIVHSIILMLIIKPTVVVAFGGYVCVPVGIAAKITGVPLLLHEQNAVAGLANKILAPLASGIAVCYQQTKSQFSKKKTRLIGNPRAALVVKTDKNQLLTSLGLKTDKSTVLIIMGSLGSETINQLLKETIPLAAHTDHQYILVTGKKHYETFVEDMPVFENVVVLDHIDQIATLSALDLIVCRAGATTVAEVIEANLPAIFIPSPYVLKNHQYENIKPLLNKDAALMIKENGLTGEVLIKQINQLLHDPQRINALKTNLRAFETNNAIIGMINWIKELSTRGKS